MKIIKREKIPTIHMEPGNTIRLSHKQTGISDRTGKVVFEEERVVLEDTITRKITVDEAVIFEVEPKDFEDAVDGIGGAILKSGK